MRKSKFSEHQIIAILKACNRYFRTFNVVDDSIVKGLAIKVDSNPATPRVVITMDNR